MKCMFAVSARLMECYRSISPGNCRPRLSRRSCQPCRGGWSRELRSQTPSARSSAVRRLVCPPPRCDPPGASPWPSGRRSSPVGSGAGWVQRLKDVTDTAGEGGRMSAAGTTWARRPLVSRQGGVSHSTADACIHARTGRCACEHGVSLSELTLGSRWKTRISLAEGFDASALRVCRKAQHHTPSSTSPPPFLLGVHLDGHEETFPVTSCQGVYFY